jgi:hypothetical protein
MPPASIFLLLLSCSPALLSGVGAAAEPEEFDAQKLPLALTKKLGTPNSKRSVAVIPSSPLDKRQTCQGSCQTCFGPGFVECPGSSLYCWDPARPDLYSCTGSGSGSGSGSSPTNPPSPQGTIGTDTCFNGGGDCKTCFGSNSEPCPSGSYYDCYEADQLTAEEACNNPGGIVGGGGSSGGSSIISSPPPASSGSSSTCEAKYGPGTVKCGPDGCYNPGAGEDCCRDGCMF